VDIKAYYKELRKEKNDLEVKDKGEYFGGTKFTNDDRDRYNFIMNEIKKIRKEYPYI
jgi:hypothetical protein